MGWPQHSYEKCLEAALLVFLLAGSACHHKRHAHAVAPRSGTTAHRANQPNAFPEGYTETGIASWYGVPYHGRPAADGEIYNMETMVAAHRLMPFNTWLRVTSAGTGRSVEVRVIDRGPFVNGRILDLSHAAAREIGLLGPGIGEVRIEVIRAPQPISGNEWYAVQVAAFSSASNAERARNEYATQYGSAQISVKQGASPLYRVLVGRMTLEHALQLARQISPTAFTVRLDETVTGEPARDTVTP